jgi:transposase-like protein
MPGTIGGVLSSAQNFAEYLGNRMKEAFQVMVERTVSEEFFSMLEEASLEGNDPSRNGYYSRKILTASGDFSIQIPRERFHLLSSRRQKIQAG